MKRMLINATQEEELRVAMVDGQRLYDLNIELPSGERKKANIYKGQITRIEPSLEAAFVNYGAERHGFLPLKEISSEYFNGDFNGKPNIKDVLQEGQDIVVQIDKEERGNKGAALTTFISLAGRFIVLKPNKSRSGGVSRRIVGEDRDLARKSMRDVSVPDGMSVILRTAGIDRSAEELEWDLNNLLAVWEAIRKVVVERPSPFLMYRESNAVVRAFRDYLTNEIGEILVDDVTAFKEAHEFVAQVMPHNLRKLKHYEDPVPLFTRYQIETQIESAFAHSVTLPSGGSLVIDHTEALVSIDINSARATKGGDIEATALNTNLEAADEIGRQLRLRDLGGLIVIDFIDMGPQKNQRDVENRLREAVRQDRARVQIGRISRFGLLEMSRQRLRPSLGESSYLTCPRCSGIGNIRSVESLALAILRIIGEEARKERTAKVIAQLPVEVATYLLNEKRDWVQSLESKNDTQVVLVANSALETPHFQIRRVRDDQVELPENSGTSYTLIDEEEQIVPEVPQSRKPAETAAIATVVPATPAPARQQSAAKPGPSLWKRIVALFSGGTKKPSSQPKRTKHDQRRRGSDNRRRGSQRSRSRSDSPRKSDKRTSDTRKNNRNQPSAKKRGNKPKDDRAESKPAAGRSANAGEKPARERDDSRADGRKAPAKRRSRGGRRRRRSNENADTNTASAAQNPGNQQPQEKSRPDTGKPDVQKPATPPQQRDSKPADADTKPAQEQKRTHEAPPKQSQPAGKRKSDSQRPAKPADEKPAATGDKAAVSAKPQPPEAKPDIAPVEPQPRAETPKPVTEKAAEAAPAAKPQRPAEAPAPAAEKTAETAPAATPETSKDTKPMPPKPAAAQPAQPELGNSGSKRPASDGKRPAAAAPSPPPPPPPAQTRADGTPKGKLLPWESATADTPKAEPKRADGSASDA